MTGQTQAPGARRAPFPTAAVIAVLAICGTVVSLQQTLVIPLLPEFPEILDTSADNASWLVTVTLLTGAVGTPILSRLADMFGKRLMMTVALSAVVIGSVIAALSPSLPLVITGRGFQGLGAALVPVGISIMRDELPPERVGAAVALMSATLGIGGAVGLPLAGVISDNFDWHALFWVSGGFGLLMLVAVSVVVPESPVRTRGKFDYPGAVLLSLALSALLLAVSKGGTWGWTDERTLGLFLASALLLALWAPVELRTGQPLVDLRTSARRTVLLTNAASVLVGFAMFANLLTTTQHLQVPVETGYGFGLSIVEAGLAMLPGGLLMVAIAPVSAALIRNLGGRIVLITGALVMAGGYVFRIFMVDTLAQIIIATTVVSLGTAVSFAAMPTLIMRSVPITETASANGLNTLIRAIGTSSSSAAIAAVTAGSTMMVGQAVLPTLDAFKTIFWLGALASLGGAAIAANIKTRTAAARDAAAREPGPVVVGPRRHELKAEGTERELVVRGTIVDPDERPIRHAVVTVLHTDGRHIDWSRADNEGSYALALPAPGRYVVVSSADGWAPQSGIMELRATESQQLMLSRPLLLAGQVSSGSEPLGSVLVSLIRHSGEYVASVHTDSQGRYEIPLPPPGRYVITVVDLPSARTVSRPVLVAAQSGTVDVDLAIDDPDARPESAAQGGRPEPAVPSGPPG